MDKGKAQTLLQSWGRVVFFLGFVLLSVFATANEKLHDFEIPQQDLIKSVHGISNQAKTLILFPYELVENRQGNAVSGRYTVFEALNKVLAGTGLKALSSSAGALTIYDSESSHLNEFEGMGMNSKKKLLASTIAFFVGGSVAQVGGAQEQDGGSGESKFMLEEIVVTAQKRDQSMQDVPISISAFSGDRLKRSGIVESMDLEMVTPGLSMGAETAIGRVFIRGVGSGTLSGPSTDSSASTYIDGVYQARFFGSLVDILDVERVEVLKGPQGTLYGRNTTGGAIKYISKKPGDDFSGEITTEIGNYDYTSLSASVDTPLIEDKLLMRTSVMKKERDGYSEHITNSSFDWDSMDLLAGRVTLQYLPTEDLDVLLHATAINDESDGAARKHLDIDPDAGFFSSALVVNDPRKIATDYGPSEAPMRHRSLDVTIKKTMDWATLTSISAYNDSSSGPWSIDNDATDIAGLHNGRAATADEPGIDGLVIESEVYTQEFTLTSTNSERLDWTLGLYYLQEDASWVTGIDIPRFSLFVRARSINKVTAYAGFGDISYSLTDNLRLNAGIRYSSETKDYKRRSENNLVIGEFSEQEETWSDWTPRIGLDYSLSDNAMVYVSVTEGFKSGGFNLGGGDPADPEFVTAYEVGAKTTAFDNRLQFNISAFKYDYEDLQVISYDFNEQVNVLNNAAKADISGLEISSVAAISENLTLDVGLSFLDAEYEEFFTQDGQSDVVDLSGNKLPQSPEFTANIGLSYEYAIDGLGLVNSRLDYYYSEEKFFNEFNDQARQPSYELVNARVAFQSADEVWDIALFGKNLTDELTYATALTSPGFFGDGYVAALNPPRTYGVAVTYNF